MKLNKYFCFNKLKLKLTPIACALVAIMIFFGSIYELYMYNNIINAFKTEFNNYNFSDANNIVLTEQLHNPFKSILLNNDLKDYFSNKAVELSNASLDNSISSEDILLQVKEIDRYNVISHDDLLNLSNSIDIIKNSSVDYNNGINYFNNENYYDAINCLKNVSSLDLNYSNSLKYIDRSRDKIKENLFSYCDELTSNDYYNKAISALCDNINIIGNSSDVKNKISEIKSKQQDYFDENSAVAEAYSSALTSDITESNINTLNIESSTPYFINVNLNNQKTYVYKGTSDNWKLIKTCPCSTGIAEENTPSGSFCIEEKGDWFFSEKYKQGGKYWTQITGDILFHSIPFARDKSTILDYTLSEPSSHGCIRLSLDDAKWIYSTIPRGSKIIIK